MGGAGSVARASSHCSDAAEYSRPEVRAPSSTERSCGACVQGRIGGRAGKAAVGETASQHHLDRSREGDARGPLLAAGVPAHALAAAAHLGHGVGEIGRLPLRRRAGRQRPGRAAEPEPERAVAAGPGGALGPDVTPGLDQEHAADRAVAGAHGLRAGQEGDALRPPGSRCG